jgi:hypothetical protein
MLGSMLTTRTMSVRPILRMLVWSDPKSSTLTVSSDCSTSGTGVGTGSGWVSETVLVRMTGGGGSFRAPATCPLLPAEVGVGEDVGVTVGVGVGVSVGVGAAVLDGVGDGIGLRTVSGVDVAGERDCRGADSTAQLASKAAIASMTTNVTPSEIRQRRCSESLVSVTSCLIRHALRFYHIL